MLDFAFLWNSLSDVNPFLNQAWQNSCLSDYSCPDQVGPYKYIFLVSNVKRGPYTIRNVNVSNSLNEEVIADGNNLEIQEAYSDIGFRLSNKPSFEKYKNNPKMLNGRKLK